MMNEDRAFTLSATPTRGRYVAYDTLNLDKQRKRVERLLGKMQRRRTLGSPRPVDTLRNHPHQKTTQSLVEQTHRSSVQRRGHVEEGRKGGNPIRGHTDL